MPISLYLGFWTIARRVIDFESGELWTFEGSAEITASAFVEQGWLRRPGSAVQAFRRYLLEIEKRNKVNVRRSDGCPFITLTCAPLQTIEHPCGADLYRGRLIFLDADRWIETWRVQGPRKHYRSVTHYDRVST